MSTRSERRSRRTPHVASVHDLHVWEVSSGFPSLSAHVLVHAGDDCHAIRRELELVLRDRFGIEHTTLQVDHVEESPLLTVTASPRNSRSASADREDPSRRPLRGRGLLGLVRPGPGPSPRPRATGRGRAGPLGLVVGRLLRLGPLGRPAEADCSAASRWAAACSAASAWSGHLLGRAAYQRRVDRRLLGGGRARSGGRSGPPRPAAGPRSRRPRRRRARPRPGRPRRAGARPARSGATSAAGRSAGAAGAACLTGASAAGTSVAGAFVRRR